jgi:hypothetical protein
MRSIFILAVVLLTGAMIAAGNQVRIISFTATPPKIRMGESVTIAWKTTGIQSVSIDWAPAKKSRGQWQRRAGLPPEGSLTITPTESTVFILTCETAAGPVCASASVTVELQPSQ